jgi:hypothetical protein
MECWPFFMVHENWLTMMKTGYYLIQKRMLQRKSAARKHTGKVPPALLPAGLSSPS